MNKGLNIFLVVFLCVISYVGLLLSFYSSDDSETWNPKMGYAMPTGRTYGTSAVSVDESSTGSDVAAISVRSANSMFHHRPSFSYAPAASMSAYSMGGSSSILPFGEGVGSQGTSAMYTTSSAEFHSFGGGGNTGGVSMSGGTVRSDNSVSSVASANIAYASLPATSVPYTYMYIPDENQAVAASVYSGAPAMVNDRYPFSSYSSQITYDVKYHSASLYGGSFATTRGITNRQKSGITNSWLDWLYQAGWNYGTGVGSDETGWTYTFTEQQLREAYDYYIENVWYWDPMWGGTENKPSFEEWLAWLKNGGDAGYEYKGNRFALAPVGGVLPLLVMAVLYVVISFLFRKRHVKNAESC